MTTKNIAQITIAIVLTIALIVFTGMELVPVEAFTGFVGVAVTWVFKEVEKEKEIARIMASLKKEGREK